VPREALFAQLAELKPDVASFCEFITPGPDTPKGYDVESILDDAIAYLKEKTGLQYYKSWMQLSGTRGILTRHPIVEGATAVRHATRSGFQDMFYRTVIDFDGQEIAIYSSHSYPNPYCCYLPRGYGDGIAPYGWDKLPGGPVTDLQTIMERERLSDREELGRDLVADARVQASKGRICIYAGDLNQPSHLDWTEATKDMYSHNGCVIPWTLSKYLSEHNFVDSYREIWPDEVKHPGFTWPVYNKDAKEKTNWTPDADERDRIDYVYYFDSGNIRTSKAQLVGPDSCVAFGKEQRDSFESSDEIILPGPLGWPSDHRGLLVTFSIDK